MPQLPLPDPPPATWVLGISGGVASGKSAAAAALAGETGRVIAADKLAHEVLASAEVVAQLRAHFGDAVLGPDGRPSRPALAELVFSDPEKRRLLEGWIHPGVRARIKALLEAAKREAVPVVVLDVPLLFENDADHHLVAACDALVFVDAPLAERDARAVAHRDWAPGEVARREALQVPLGDKRDASHFVIRNDGGPDDLLREARRVLAALGLPPQP